MTDSLNRGDSYYKSRTGNALKWNTILAFSSQIAGLAISITLARLLPPSDFGLLAMVTVITGFATIFLDAGTGSSVIQKVSIDQVDLSSVFYYNIIVSLFLSLTIFNLAVPISNFYSEPRLILIVKVVAWQPLISALSVVQKSLLARDMVFKKQVLAQLSGQICAGFIGISMALYGYGVWSLVASTYTALIVTTAVFWISGKWLPSFLFSRKSFVEVWGYSSNLLATNLSREIVDRTDLVIIGKSLSPFVLGLYNKSKGLAMLPGLLISQVFSKSFFPLLSRLQKEKKDFGDVFLKQTFLISIFTLPVFVWMALSSYELIIFILGKNWEAASPLFAIVAIIALIYSNATIRIYAINALGHPRLNLRRGLILSGLRLLTYLIIYFGFTEILPQYFLFSFLAFSVIGFIWLSTDVSSRTHISFYSQLTQFKHPLIGIVISSILFFAVINLLNAVFLKLLLGFMVFMGGYILTLAFLGDLGRLRVVFREYRNL